jgi:predicted RNA-binding Zn-ribbon protein involved in translation (DUF1610 family)
MSERCKNCNKLISDNLFLHCPYCGAEIERQEEKEDVVTQSKIYKIEIYVVDLNETVYDITNIQDIIDNEFNTISHISKIEISNNFEWDDSLKINSIFATKEDFEKYFESSKNLTETEIQNYIRENYENNFNNSNSGV